MTKAIEDTRIGGKMRQKKKYCVLVLIKKQMKKQNGREENESQREEKKTEIQEYTRDGECKERREGRELRKIME